MASLVTLNAAPYNPYGDTFGRFAMQGLQMGIQQMQFREQMAARAAEQTQQAFSQATQNAFKGLEFELQGKEFEHRKENDAFNNMLRKEQLEFSKVQHKDQIGLESERLDLAKSQFDYMVKHDQEVDDPYQQAITKKMQEDAAFSADTAELRKEAMRLKNEDASAVNDINQMTAQVYKDNPNMIRDQKLAEHEYKIQQAASLKARANYYSNKNSDVDFMTPKQASDAMRAAELSLFEVMEKEKKVKPERKIPDGTQVKPEIIKIFEEQNEKSRQEREELRTLREQIEARRARLSDKVMGRGHYSPTPASSTSSVQLPGESAAEFVSRISQLNQAAQDAGGKTPSQQAPTPSWKDATEE